MEFLSLKQGADKVLRLTRRMLETAENGDWELLGQLEQERSRSLESLFQHLDMPEQLPAIAGALQEIMDIDRDCIELSVRARDKMAAAMHQQVQGRRAVRNYLDCQN